MATHDYVIDNQSAPSLRADLNNALQAIVTQNSSATAPTVTYADMIWYDTANNQLKKRNEANSAWIVLGTIDEGTGTFTPSGQISTPFTSFQLFTSSGTWTRPSGVTEVYAVVVGGGAGGPQNTNAGSGGFGGATAGFVSVSGNVTVTVGAGGTGSNTANGTAGGTSSFSTLSATGGPADWLSNGAGSGGDLTYDGLHVGAGDFSLTALAVMPNGKPSGIYRTLAQNSLQLSGTTAPVTYSTSGGAKPGAKGSKETGSTSNDAKGGCGGAVWVLW